MSSCCGSCHGKQSQRKMATEAKVRRALRLRWRPFQPIRSRQEWQSLQRVRRVGEQGGGRTGAQNSRGAVFRLMRFERNLKCSQIGWFNESKHVRVRWNHVLVVVNGAHRQQPCQASQFLACKQRAQTSRLQVHCRNRHRHDFLQQRVVRSGGRCWIEVQSPHIGQQLQR